MSLLRGVRCCDRDQCFLLRARPRLQLRLALQRRTQRVTLFDIHQRYRKSRARIFRAFPRVVGSNPCIRIAGEAGIEGAVRTSHDVDEHGAIVGGSAAPVSLDSRWTLDARSGHHSTDQTHARRRSGIRGLPRASERSERVEWWRRRESNPQNAVFATY